MGSVVNVNPNPEGLIVVLDGRERHVALGETLDDLTADQVESLLQQSGNWAAPKSKAPRHTKKEEGQ